MFHERCCDALVKQKRMAAPSDSVEAALARVEAADAEHDAAAITRELAALPCSELVVARCCKALLHHETARAAAVSTDALLLVLDALRSHTSRAVVTKACDALYHLLHNGASAETAVKHGALELALAGVNDTTMCAIGVHL